MCSVKRASISGNTGQARLWKQQDSYGPWLQAAGGLVSAWGNPWMLAWDSSVRKNELLSLRMSTQPPASWFAAFWLHLGPVIMGLREMTWSLAGLWVAGPPQAQWQPAWQKPSSGDRPCSPEPPPMPVFLLFPSAPRISALAPGSAIRRLSVHTFLELCLIPWCLMSWKENIPIRQSTQLSIYYSCNSLVWCAPMFLL